MQEAQRSTDALVDPAQLFAAGPEALLVVREGRIACANERALDLVGRPIAGLDLAEVIPDWRAAPDDAVPFEAMLRCADGELAVEVRVRELEDGVTVASLRDARALIAGREAEAALADAEERYRGLVEQIPAVVYADDGNVTTYVNPQIEHILGVTPAGLPGRSEHVAPHGAPGRPGDGGVAEPGVHRRRGGRSRRLPDGPSRRRDRVGARPRLRPPRRRRPRAVGARHPVRRHRAEGSRSADRAHGLPRRPDRARQPGALRRDAGARRAAREARRDGGRRPVPGPGQLQAGERLARPPRGRPAVDPARGPAQRLHARHRPRGAAGRRRVPHAARRPRPRRLRRGDPGRHRPRVRGDGRAVRPARARSSSREAPSASACIPTTRTTSRP